MDKSASENNTETMGFKDKEKALHTLKCLEGRDITYQFRAINTYYTSAKKVLKITKDETKRKNISEAIVIFDEWIRDYKENNRGQNNLSYLPIKTVEAFVKLAHNHNIDTDFYEAFKKVDGDYKALRNVKVDENESVTWDIERNRRLKELIKKIKSSKVSWYEAEKLPSKEHLECILLGYSPEPAKLREILPKIANTSEPTDEKTMEVDESPKKGSKRNSDCRSKSDSSESDEPATKISKKNENSEKSEESSLGFKDKEKALKSIESLKGRDISYQYYAISGLLKRAERVISCTKDQQKIDNIKAAVEVLENWITDYNVNHRSRENFAYLNLELLRAYVPLAEKYELEIPGFVAAYEEVKGDYKKLRSVKVPDEDVTWDIERNKRLRPLVEMIKEKHIQWFATDEPLRGLPTKEHTECILWGFSHEPGKLKKTLKLLNEKLECKN